MLAIGGGGGVGGVGGLLFPFSRYGWLNIGHFSTRTGPLGAISQKPIAVFSKISVWKVLESISEHVVLMM